MTGMVVILDLRATRSTIEAVTESLQGYGFGVHPFIGGDQVVRGAVGGQPDFDVRPIKVLDGIKEVFRIHSELAANEEARRRYLGKSFTLERYKN